VSAERIGQAIASYERTLIAGDSRFDRWRYGSEANALSETERRGFELFNGKARCGQCHRIAHRVALFTDHDFHNTGIGWHGSYATPERTRVELAPGVHAEVDRRIIETFSEPPAKDVGRFEITLNPADRWAYKTPGLRNVALTAPYMHDGSLATLESVVAFYDAGGIDNPGKSPLLKPIGLNAAEREALVAFLRSLTGSAVGALVAEARKQPVGQ
jgi:cytochrome c peroxidase